MESFDFLCQDGDNVFVSNIGYDDVLGLYVDDIRHKSCISIDELEEIQIILHKSDQL